MSNLETALREHPGVSDYKINIQEKKSYEMFFVKGKLETVRRTKTCDTEVTVYSEHDGFLGDAKFVVYPSTTDEELNDLIEDAVGKALLMNNPFYVLPEKENGEYEVESNFSVFSPEELAAAVANTVFDANTLQNGSLNSVEIFVNQYKETVKNSRRVCKVQTRYDAMAEVIPTFNGEKQSVELYEQYNFSSFDADDLYHEIAEMMQAVQGRYEAVKPDFEMDCSVVLNKLELSELFARIAQNLQYAAQYMHASMYHKGDMLQSAPVGDHIGITMAGAAKGNVRSSSFDSDGLTLGEIRIVENGKAVNYYGDNRFGQYLGETPTGNLRCICVDCGSKPGSKLMEMPCLEVISMSGLQVDFFSDYIGGEVRLAYYHNGTDVIPVTGISFAGSVREAMNHIRLSSESVTCNGYTGPKKAAIRGMKIF